MERVAPTATSITLDANLKLIYEPPNAPLEVPMMVLNKGGDVIEVRMLGSGSLIPVPAGYWVRANPAGRVYARAQSSVAEVLVTFGIEVGRYTATSSGGYSSADAASLAAASTQKELLAGILLQLLIQSQQLALMTDEEVTVSDLPAGQNVWPT